MSCYNNGLGSFQKWYIGNTIRDILLSNEELVNDVNSNIYPIVAAENTDGDFIVYSRIKYAKTSVKMGVYQDECQVAITVVSDDYDKSIDIASKIDNTLSGQHKIDGVKIRIILVDSSETFEDNKYEQTLIFSVE